MFTQTSSAFCSIQPQCQFYSHKSSAFPTASGPLSLLTFTPLSLNFSRNARRVVRFQAKAADPDEVTPQVSGDNVADSTLVQDVPASTSFLSVLCPLLRLVSSGDPSRERNYALEGTTSAVASFARLLWGSRVLSTGIDTEDVEAPNPPKRIQLFEFEACPFCRRVREAITELDLSVEVYPCPKGSLRHRNIVREIGGKEQFPFLIDANTGVSMYESGDIVNYLFRQYGKGGSPTIGLLESTLFTGWIPTILRAGRGMALWEKARKDPPPKKLELFSYENNPYARIVREALCELELPYILQSVGEGSQRTNVILEMAGTKEVPYLIDPNTGVKIGDYKKILSYLFTTYSRATT